MQTKKIDLGDGFGVFQDKKVNKTKTPA